MADNRGDSKPDEAGPEVHSNPDRKHKDIEVFFIRIGVARQDEWPIVSVHGSFEEAKEAFFSICKDYTPYAPVIVIQSTIFDCKECFVQEMRKSLQYGQ